ncbi:hypothetical protein CRENBAI_004718 [Crenichthys baileyi]|uniref:Uncharacterized protein n=1 Tax=Crenichthys baileyi TaxID=28760 RepID=A0AAV9R5H8_9TELE
MGGGQGGKESEGEEEEEEDSSGVLAVIKETEEKREEERNGSDYGAGSGRFYSRTKIKTGHSPASDAETGAAMVLVEQSGFCLYSWNRMFVELRAAVKFEHANDERLQPAMEKHHRHKQCFWQIRAVSFGQKNRDRRTERMERVYTRPLLPHPHPFCCWSSRCLGSCIFS